VLEKLGVVIDLGPADVERSVAQAGIGFCFAPVFHSGMRHAGPTRRELGIPTAFNVLGPLSNPGQPAAGAIGCAYPLIAPIMAQVFASRGQNALVFRGDDGLDEITTTTTSQVWTVVDGDPRQQEFDPESVGIARAGAEALRGGDPDFNAAVVHRVLAGDPGPVRDAVLLNAAAAIAAFDNAPGDIHEVIAYGLPIAAAAIDTGAARELLATWVSVTAALAAS
jgi:anthranilate phosphoribosyltransferase